jgi:hypothetical protein
MYKDVLKVSFGDILWLLKAVEVRHDCVHRAGKNKEDEKVSITKDDLEELVEQCRDLSKSIYSQIDSTKKT